MQNQEAVEQISTLIRSGELPSAVLRNLMAGPQKWSKHSLASPMAEAFPECGDHWHLIYPVWHWKERERSETWDALFDFTLIRALVGAGVRLPWTQEQCTAELERIEPRLQHLNEAKKAKAMEAVSFDNLRVKVEAMAGKLACVQVLWDGDTNGWFLCMSAIVEQGGEYTENHLGTFTQGGDIRLFNGTVPPWPEAVAASETGARLAAHFGAVLHYPSPDQPNDGCAAWAPRPRSLPVGTLSIRLSRLLGC